MKYYNRDDFERNLESYEVPEYFTSGEIGRASCRERV